MTLTPTGQLYDLYVAESTTPPFVVCAECAP